MTYAKATIGLLLIFCASSLLAQDDKIEGLKAICVREQSTGFNWENGRWVRTNFKPGNQFLIQRLNLEAYASKPTLEQPALCQIEPVRQIGTTKISKGCYQINDVGEPPVIFLSEMCDEIVEGKQIVSIQCRKITFNPDGGFIELPWHADISTSPRNNRKDSLVLSVGKCSRLTN